MTEYNFVNWANVKPLTLKANDAIALKVVAVAGEGHEWAAYMGLTTWTDQQTAEEGDKVYPPKAAELLFPQFPAAGWRYRR